MKRISILLILSVCFLNNVISQEKTKTREVGLYFTSLNSFGIRYKTGNEKILLRLTALSLNTYKSEDKSGAETVQNRSHAGFGFNIGIEKPINVNDQFNFYYGLELMNSIIYDKVSDKVLAGTTTTKMNSYIAGCGVVLGLSYNFKSNVKISAEIIPSFGYQYLKQDDRKYNNIHFGFDSNSAGLTISYKF